MNSGVSPLHPCRGNYANLKGVKNIMGTVEKDNVFYLMKSIAVLNGEIDGLKGAIGKLAEVVGNLNDTITQKMEEEKLERFRGSEKK